MIGFDWITMNPIKVNEPTKSNLPQIYTFKYKIGDVFYDPNQGNIIEITGYNYSAIVTYKGDITTKNASTTTIIKTNTIYQSALDKLERYDSLSNLMDSKKKNGINYRIHYVDLDTSKKVVKEKVKHTTMTMTGIRALAKMLNSMIKRNPNRKIIMVSVVDDQGIYLKSVKFLPEEIKKQVFLTGMKERLLAFAKYECGYDIAIGF
jgi:hypothetical protein